ncbi:hypothetical protein NQ317_009277 [Molorchus minor]|uniref:Uncharacterized protein n=1 Tax=Molorchus minor TaxID=1323400 RepID=A0ABQ9K0G9_9CUCU|nr:hypothetical protein NQ317_009277 [Molorchus minor]
MKNWLPLVGFEPTLASEHQSGLTVHLVQHKHENNELKNSHLAHQIRIFGEVVRRTATKGHIHHDDVKTTVENDFINMKLLNVLIMSIIASAFSTPTY